MPAIITRDLIQGISEGTDRYFRLANWDPRVHPTNAMRGTIAIVVLPASTITLQKIDEGTTTGWVELAGGGGTGLLQEYIRAFTASSATDWTPNGSSFQMVVQHNFNDNTPLVTIFDASGIETLCEYVILNQNSIRLQVPSSPDLRFTGHVRVTRT